MIEGYRERTLSAAKWSVSGDMMQQSIRSVCGIVLARLLSPGEFGQLAMLTVLTQFVGALADLGFGEAIIQKRELTEAHRSSVFWTLLVVGSLLTLGLIAAAPWIGAFYGVQELAPLAVVLSAVFVLDAIGTVPRALVVRRLDFRVVAWLQCAAAAVACACAVGLAWLGFGVLSLAANLLVTAALEALLFFGASAWRPHFEFRVAMLGDLLGFGSSRLASRTLAYSADLDQLLVGKFLGSGALGLYTRAYNFTRLPTLYVSWSVGRVMFPSLALIQHDEGRVRDVYLRTIGAVALATFPMCMGLCAVAEPLIVGVLGPQWRETIPILRILSVAGVVQSIVVQTSSLCLSQGRADLQLRLTALQRVSTLAAILLGLQWGILGLATAYVLAKVFNALPTLYFSGRLIHLPVTKVLTHIFPVFLASAVMTVIVLGIDAWTALQLHPLELLGAEVVAGVLVYWSALRLLRVAAYFDVIALLWQRSAAAQEA